MDDQDDSGSAATGREAGGDDGGPDGGGPAPSDADGHETGGRRVGGHEVGESAVDARATETDYGELVAALVGGVVSIVLSWIPFAPVLGGAVAGYLRGGSTNDGLRAGALSGVVTFLPLLLLAFLVGGLVLAVFSVQAPASVTGLGAVLFLFLLAVGLAYTVGLGALGGWLGSYVRREDVL